MEKHIEQTLVDFEKYNSKLQMIYYDKDRYRDLLLNSNSIDQLNKNIIMLNTLWGVGLNKIEDVDIQK
jgi:hypothetical protein